MKSSSLRSRRAGFTLVELLVVIAIIGILATVTVQAIFTALASAKRTKAQNMANQLLTAMTQYQTEYSVFPNQNAAAADTYYDSADSTGLWYNVMVALCGDVDPRKPGIALTPAPEMNSRHIAFMSPSYGDLDANTGILKQPFPSKNGQVQFFFMAVDTDYSGSLGDANSAVNGKLPNFTTGANAAWTSSNYTTSAVDFTGQTSQGVAIWCNNDQPLNGAKSNPSFWGHTY